MLDLKYLQYLLRDIGLLDVVDLKCYILEDKQFKLIKDDDFIKSWASKCMKSREFHVYVDMPESSSEFEFGNDGGLESEGGEYKGGDGEIGNDVGAKVETDVRDEIGINVEGEIGVDLGAEDDTTCGEIGTDVKTTSDKDVRGEIRIDIGAGDDVASGEIGTDVRVESNTDVGGEFGIEVGDTLDFRTYGSTNFEHEFHGVNEHDVDDMFQKDCEDGELHGGADIEGGSGEGEGDGDASETAIDDEGDFIESEYEMDEDEPIIGKQSYNFNMEDTNINSSGLHSHGNEVGGSGINIEDMSDGDKSDNDMVTAVANLDEIRTSDEEDDGKKKAPTFNPSEIFKPTITLAMLFSNKAEFKKAVQSLAITSNRPIKFTRSTPDRVYAKCEANDCGWKIHANRVKHDITFQVTK